MQQNRFTPIIVSTVILAGSALLTTAVADDLLDNLTKRDALVRKAGISADEGNSKKAAGYYADAAEYCVDEAEQTLLLHQCADCLFDAGKYEPAYQRYADLLRNHSFYVRDRERLFSRLRSLADRFLWGDASLFNFKNTDRAVDIYELITDEAPLGEQSLNDWLMLARLQSSMRRPGEAAETYRGLLQRYPRAEATPGARLALAHLLIEEAKRNNRNPDFMRRAERQLEIFHRRNPGHQRRDEGQLLADIITEWKADALLKLGEFYLREPHRRPEASRRYLWDVVHQYRDTTSAVLAEIILDRIQQGDETGETSDSAVSGADDEGEGREDTGHRASERPGPEEMTPPRNPSPEDSGPVIREQESIQKWLRPLEDLSDSGKEVGGDE